MRFKSIVFFLLANCIVFVGKAQYYKDKEVLAGASVGYQYPMGDFGDQAKGGPVFRLTGQMMLNKKLGVGAEIAYSLLGQNDFWNGSHLGKYDVNYDIASVQVKGSYYFDSWDREFRPYASLAFGYFHYQNSIKFISTSGGSINQKRTVKENKVGLTPIVGFLYHLSSTWSFDMNLRYTYIPDFPESVSATDEYGETYPYYLGFKNITLPELSIGLFYRF
ncbi:hypothetical protein BZG02_12090 [Labilibaculum filiforme]|uniref:Outer membrane protein beta-barrel domain-containing protein n=1 Tax=Labilibaculum filiforme TaxID=1940526 RepID=A0A2N3HWN6_9BACT|nr:outer membrane beta-barrel protein [Labilibaculum filiforme]PKQ62462.1 hypothetical protein BZG02_12090 [Labilibaculum filiforme]